MQLASQHQKTQKSPQQNSSQHLIGQTSIIDYDKRNIISCEIISSQNQDKIKDLEISYEEFQNLYKVIGDPIKNNDHTQTQIYKCELVWKKESFIIKKLLSSTKEEFDKELSIHFHLMSRDENNSKIVRIVQWMKQKKESLIDQLSEKESYFYYIIMEEGEHDLQAHLQALQSQKLLTPQTQLSFINQVLEISLFLSSENVLHLDLKSVQFIYFPKDDRIKLTDFGSALYLGSTLEENAKKLGLVGQFLRMRGLTKMFLMPEFQQLIKRPDKFWNEAKMADKSKRKFIEYFGLLQDSYSIGIIISCILGGTMEMLKNTNYYSLVNPDFFKRKTIRQLLKDKTYVKYDYDAEFMFRIIVIFEPDFPDVKTKQIQPKTLQVWHDEIVSQNVQFQGQNREMGFIPELSSEELENLNKYKDICNIDNNVNRLSVFIQQIKNFGIDYINYNNLFYSFSSQLLMRIMVERMSFQDEIYNVTFSKLIHEYFGLYFLLFANLFAIEDEKLIKTYIVQLNKLSSLVIRQVQEIRILLPLQVQEDGKDGRRLLCIGHKLHGNTEAFWHPITEVTSVCIMFIDPKQFHPFKEKYITRTIDRPAILKNYEEEIQNIGTFLIYQLIQDLSFNNIDSLNNFEFEDPKSNSDFYRYNSQASTIKQGKQFYSDNSLESPQRFERDDPTVRH